MKAQTKRPDKQNQRERQDTRGFYKALFEESHNLAVIADRTEELTISFEDWKKRLGEWQESAEN